MMNTTYIEGDDPSGHDNGDMHPILGNYHLPVEIENSRKQSGMHNLSREGWGEESEWSVLDLIIYKPN